MLDPDIEIIRLNLPRGRFRAALFDFDGTLSLLREGWPEVMISMMVGILQEVDPVIREPEWTAIVEEFVMQLNGRPTLEQMVRFAEEIQVRGGEPLDSSEYKRMFLDRLMVRVGSRISDLQTGRVEPTEWMVSGASAILEALSERGVALYLASGTDLASVRREAELLGLAHYFGNHIYAPRDDDDRSFSKRAVIARMQAETKATRAELVGFGDGVIEIEELKRAGGVAVAVASDVEHRGRVNAWKRDRLIRAGADIVIADFDPGDRLVAWLFDEE